MVLRATFPRGRVNSSQNASFHGNRGQERDYQGKIIPRRENFALSHEGKFTQFPLGKILRPKDFEGSSRGAFLRSLRSQWASEMMRL